MAVVMIALNGGFFDRSVHAFDLTVGPRMLDLGEAVLNAVLAAAHIKHMGQVPGRWAIGVTRRKCELNAVIGEHGVNFVRSGFNKRRQEDGRGRSASLLHKLYEGNFADPVDRNIQVEPAFGGPYFGNVDVEIADRIGLELFLFRFVAFDFRQSRNAMTPQAAMQRGARQMRDRRLERRRLTGEQVPTRPHDSGSQANETVDGLDASTEALRHAAEDTPTGASPGDVEKTPVI